MTLNSNRSLRAMAKLQQILGAAKTWAGLRIACRRTQVAYEKKIISQAQAEDIALQAWALSKHLPEGEVIDDESAAEPPADTQETMDLPRK